MVQRCYSSQASRTSCGPLLQEQALKVATDLRNNNFKASNVWLDSFRWWRDIAFIRTCGESGDVDNAIVNDWKQKLLSLLGHDPKDVFNMDETGLFFMLGEKVNPLVIWRHANPRCFKGIKKDQLSVGYYSNKNAWMTSGVFETWLKKLNHKVAFEKRKMLFLDNALSHPTVEYSNIKFQFFPPNTTVLQPMDQGITQAIKVSQIAMAKTWSPLWKC